MNTQKIFGGIAVAIAIAGGVALKMNRGNSVYSDAKDPIRAVEYETAWDMTVHNIGPDADVISVWYDPKNYYETCAIQTFMSSGERRRIENYCPQATETSGMWVLTKQQYDRTNWRDVARKDYEKENQ